MKIEAKKFQLQSVSQLQQFSAGTKHFSQFQRVQVLLGLLTNSSIYNLVSTYYNNLVPYKYFILGRIADLADQISVMSQRISFSDHPHHLPEYPNLFSKDPQVL